MAESDSKRRRSPVSRNAAARLGRAAIGRAGVALLLALVGPLGCAAGYNLNVSLSPDYAKTLGDEKVYVHVVGVNPNDRPQLEAMSVNRYWRYDDAPVASANGQPAAEPTREEDTSMLELSARKPTALITENDPLWKKWHGKGASYLMILASRPLDVAGNAPGAPDPRRRFLPFARSAWVDTNVHVEVTGGGLRVQTGLVPTSH